MTPTELWDIYYHAMKRWLPTSNDKSVREAVSRLMDLSSNITIDSCKKRCPQCKKREKIFIDCPLCQQSCWQCQSCFYITH